MSCSATVPASAGRAWPTYRALFDEASCREALTLAQASLDAVGAIRADLEQRRQTTADELAAAKIAVSQAAEAMATGAAGKGSKGFTAAVRSHDELVAAIGALDATVLPAAQGKVDEKIQAVDQASRELNRARIAQIAAAELVPADRRIFRLLADLEAAIAEATRARVTLFREPGVERFHADARHPLGESIWARGVEGRRRSRC